MKLPEAIRGVKKETWNKIEDYNQKLDDESVRRYIARIMKEDEVSYEEAWRLVQEDPKYSLGYKMCSPAIVMMLKMRGGPERFKQMLTPEELRIFESEVEGKIDFKKAVRKEMKKQKRDKRGAFRA